jgi:hypothetical protein
MKFLGCYDLDVAVLAARNDAEAQQAVASYMAQQQQAFDQRDDRRKMQPSGNSRIVGIHITLVHTTANRCAFPCTFRKSALAKTIAASI